MRRFVIDGPILIAMLGFVFFMGAVFGAAMVGVLQMVLAR